MGIELLPSAKGPETEQMRKVVSTFTDLAIVPQWLSLSSFLVHATAKSRSLQLTGHKLFQTQVCRVAQLIVGWCCQRPYT